MITYFCLILLVFAVADYAGVKTKSLLSGPFVSLLTFLVLFQLKVIPADIVERSGMTPLASLSLYLMMVDTGTMIDLRTLKREWRTAVLGICSIAFSAVGILCILPVIGRSEALTVIPVMSSGLQGTIIILNAATEKGLTLAYTLGIVGYALKKFVGTIVASFVGRKEAQRLIKEYREQALRVDGVSAMEKEVEQKTAFWERHSKYYTNPTILAIAALLGWAGDLLQSITGINYTIFCLLLGFAARNLGLLPEKALTRAKTAGILHVACFANLIPPLATISAGDLVQMVGPLLMVFGAVLVSISFFVLVLPGWKIVGSRHLAMGICMGQMLAFPSTMLVSSEIVSGYTETPEEAAYLEQKLMIPYILGGLVSATICSVVLASFCAGLL